jgi:hypothetical protein
MAANQPINEADLRGFLEAAGRSLSEAQAILGGEQPVSASLVIASADLEVKAGLKSDGSGGVLVQPISAQDLAQTRIDAAALSTVRVSFVATAPDAPPGGVLGTPPAGPVRAPVDVANEVRLRPDVLQLDRILGGLKIDAVYIPQTERWLVTAQDTKGRVVREVILPDQPKEGPIG